MGQKWMIDVLADLRTFANRNGLPLLVKQLDITATVAQAEIANVIEGTPHGGDVDAGQPAPLHDDDGLRQPP